jgi:hypothetical protein
VHYDFLDSGLTSAKDFFSTFSSLAPQHFLYLPYWVYQQYYHAVDSLSKYLVLAWKGRHHIKSPVTIDVPTAVGMFIGKAKEAVRLLNHEESSLCVEQILDQLISRVRAFEELHEARLAAAQSYDISMNAASRNSVQDAIFALPHGMSWQFLESE